MAKIVAISGPSSSGKSELFEALESKLLKSGVIFMPDIFKTTWQELVDNGLLYEEEDINKDTEILCCFVQRVIDKYKGYIDSNKILNDDSLVIIDGCWLDLSIYSTINFWYNHTIKEVQEKLLSQIAEYDSNIDKIYITSYDEVLNTTEKYHSRYKRYNQKYNRPLEIQYYKMANNFKNAFSLPAYYAEELADLVIEDLRNSGYLD